MQFLNWFIGFRGVDFQMKFNQKSVLSTFTFFQKSAKQTSHHFYTTIFNKSINPWIGYWIFHNQNICTEFTDDMPYFFSFFKLLKINEMKRNTNQCKHSSIQIWTKHKNVENFLFTLFTKVSILLLCNLDDIT